MMDQKSLSPCLPSAQDETVNTSQNDSGALVQDNIQRNLESAMDSVIETNIAVIESTKTSLSTGSSPRKDESEDNNAHTEPSAVQVESPDIFTELFEPIAGLLPPNKPQDEITPQVHDVGAMGDGLHAHVPDREESSSKSEEDDSDGKFQRGV